MCFKSKVKTPKVDPNTALVPPPEPINLKGPEGVQFGDDTSDETTDNEAPSSGRDSLKTDRNPSGDGTAKPTATDTGLTKKASKKTGSISRAMKL